ncbi:MAG: hypothetical protein ACODAE_09815 [Gemmatimonadota bacterium]
MIAFYVLLALALVRYAALGLLVALILRPAPWCPACFGDNVRIRSRWLDRLAPGIERRWCPHCGWQALARRTPRHVARRLG